MERNRKISQENTTMCRVYAVGVSIISWNDTYVHAFVCVGECVYGCVYAFSCWAKCVSVGHGLKVGKPP